MWYYYALGYYLFFVVVMLSSLYFNRATTKGSPKSPHKEIIGMTLRWSFVATIIFMILYLFGYKFPFE